MAQFSVNVNPQRFDPYKNFKFRIKWDGKYVAGVSKVGPLKRTTEVVKHREGGDPSSSRKSPGRTEYDAITLERGDHPRSGIRELGEARLEFRFSFGVRSIPQEFPKRHNSRNLQRSRTEGDRL